MRPIKYFALLASLLIGNHVNGQSCDVVVYGGTPAGISAAVAAAKDGCQVILVEPYQRIGGLMTNGLSHTDIRTLEGRTGAFFDFAQRVTAHYMRQDGADSEAVKSSFEGIFAEPKVNQQVFEQLIAEHSKIQVLYQHRLKAVNRSASADKSRNRLTSLVLQVPNKPDAVVTARSFIDATYEGDLMASSGVKWRAGREGRDEYGESLAPTQADNQLQAYNFRFIMTNEPTNRVKPEAPAGYRREDFVGVLEPLRSGAIKSVFGYPSNCIFKAQTPALPHAKYDINDVSRNIVRLSLPGKNLRWPDGDWSTRQAIYNEHLRDQVGLLYFLQNDPEVPSQFRQEAQDWGWCRDEFVQTNHIPEQLYVREARRMVGMHVYTQRDSEHSPGDARSKWHRDSIAIGDYGNNCHGTAHQGPRFGGSHTGEFYNAVPPYQIPYLVLIPHEVDNLLVSTAVSSSHVGFCALRLEPIWMSLGQAAGHAAAIAAKQDCSVQQVDVRQLQHHLHAAGAATIYISDVPPGHPDFAMVQWWGASGGWHGLRPMPAKAGQRGRNLHGQYYAAYPDHSADLDQAIDDKTIGHWRALATSLGIPENKLPETKAGTTTRGEFLRQLYKQNFDSN